MLWRRWDSSIVLIDTAGDEEENERRKGRRSRQEKGTVAELRAGAAYLSDNKPIVHLRFLSKNSI